MTDRFVLPAEAIQVIRRRRPIRTAGGPGSGNFGHAGRPGEIGGSAPSGISGLTSAYDFQYQGPVQQLHRKLMRHFVADENFETLGSVSKDGIVSNVIIGDDDQVAIPTDVVESWKENPPFLVAHTHPSSGAPSVQDLEMQIKTGVPKQAVFGKDGSWHELTITDSLDIDDLRTVIRISDKEYNAAQRRSNEKIDNWIAQQTGWKYISPNTFESSEHGQFRLRSLDDPLVSKLNAEPQFLKYWADESPQIWKSVSEAVPKVQYRYYRP